MCLFIENKVGYNEDIERFAMPQGMLTSSFSVIRCTDFSGFRVDFSIELCPYVTGHHGISAWGFLDNITSD